VIDTERGLLNAILIHPHDDMMRLVYADWLTENGQDERAEFIRIQVAVRDGTATEYEKNREGELFRRLRGEWEDDDILDTPNPDWFADPDGKRGDRAALLIAGGFPAEVRAPLSWLTGGECQECGHEESRIDPSTCPYCHGTGRINAHLPELVRTHPITRVLVTDREPGRIPGRDLWGWDHEIAETEPRRWDLPVAVWRSLRPTVPDVYIGCFWWYDTREAALADLSAAIIHVAKFGDKKPVTWDGGRCRWSSDAIEVPLFSVRQHPEAILPAAIFDRLGGYDPNFVGHGHKFYDDTDAAYAALWEAIVTA
jgi:uncharacterized protein (TIGR02996 family)